MAFTRIVAIAGLTGLTLAALPTRGDGATIIFQSGAYIQTFAPPDGAGAIEYRTGTDPTTEIVIVNAAPGQRSGTDVNDATSPIQTKDGNPGEVRVITDLAIGHGQSLINLEADGSTTGSSFSTPLGSLAQSFSASGLWRVELGPKEKLQSVTLRGKLRGDLRLDPPSALAGSASANLSGSVKVDPFGSFNFATGEKTGSGSFGLGISATGGSISFSVTPGSTSVAQITYAETLAPPQVSPGVNYSFSLGANLESSLTSFGILGGAFSVSNLWEDEFELIPAVSRVPLPASAWGMILALGLLGVVRLGNRRVRSRSAARQQQTQ